MRHKAVVGENAQVGGKDVAQAIMVPLGTFTKSAPVVVVSAAEFGALESVYRAARAYDNARMGLSAIDEVRRREALIRLADAVEVLRRSSLDVDR